MIESFQSNWQRAYDGFATAERGDLEEFSPAFVCLGALQYDGNLDNARRWIRAQTVLASVGLYRANFEHQLPSQAALGGAYGNHGQLLGRVLNGEPTPVDDSVTRTTEGSAIRNELSIIVASALLLRRQDPSFYPLPKFSEFNERPSRIVTIINGGDPIDIEHLSTSRSPVVTPKADGPGQFCFGKLLEQRGRSNNFRGWSEKSHTALRTITAELIYLETNDPAGMSDDEEKWLSTLSNATARYMRDAIV